MQSDWVVGWWLSGCRSSVAEHWLHMPGVLGLISSDCQLTSLYNIYFHCTYVVSGHTLTHFPENNGLQQSSEKYLWKEGYRGITLSPNF